MSRTIKFTKMQGLGNDYIYVNTLLYPVSRPEECAVAWSAYHTGIGSDGLVLIGSSDKADFSMRIFNADGSEAMMCGNASRCIGKYLYDNRLTRKTSITLDTLSGIRTLDLHVENDAVISVTVDMGEPKLAHPDQLTKPSMLSEAIAVAGETYYATFVCMGNPHLVIFVDDVCKIDVAKVGAALEHHPFFPERVNVEFVQVLKEGVLRMRVWERGSGITMACGTGACASAVAASLTKRSGRASEVLMDGGRLFIRWDETDGKVYMTGPAAKVFDGEITEA